jgi:hypothetical protein
VACVTLGRGVVALHFNGRNLMRYTMSKWKTVVMCCAAVVLAIGSIRCNDEPKKFSVDTDNGADGDSDSDSDGDSDGDYTIQVSVVGEGTVALDPDQDTYESGDEVTLTATPGDGWGFGGWSGDEEDDGAALQVTVDGDLEITATFVELYDLAVTVEGQGTVTRTPDQDGYLPGAAVTLAAAPDDGWGFGGWSGALSGDAVSADLVMDGDKDVTATFVELVDTDTDPSEDIATFTVSWITSDLDPQDGVDMRTGLLDKGYTELGESIPVAKAELIGFYENPEIGIQFHTGHGDNGVILMNDLSSTVGVTDFAAGGILCQYAIAATCLTMTADAWQDKMGPSCDGLMGYTDVTADYDDEIMVADFLAALGGGTMAYTWYQANTEVETDHWRILFREGDGTISDYKPSNLPSAKGLPGRAVDLNAAVSASASVADSRETFATAFEAMADTSLVVAPTGREMTDLGGGAEFLAKTPMTEAEARAVAGAWMRGRLPADAVLDAVVPITAKTPSFAEQVVAYTVRYKREIGGLEVQGNGENHNITLLVNDGRAIAESWRWPEIEAQTSTAPIATSLMPVGEALAFSADAIARAVKSPVRIVGVEPCWGLGEVLVPAYEFDDASGLRFVVDARTGELVR